MENPLVTIVLFTLAFIFGILGVSIIYDIVRFFAKPETVQCKDYTVESKDKEELQFARKCRYCDFYIDPIFRKAFEGDEYKIGLAKDSYLSQWQSSGYRPSTMSVLALISDIQDTIGPVKPLNVEIQGVQNGQK